jgi:hypothetical protein
MPDSRYPPEFFLSLIHPHRPRYQLLVSILVWRRPLVFTLVFFAIELFSLIVYMFDLCFLSGLSLAIGFFHAFWFVWSYFDVPAKLRAPDTESEEPDFLIPVCVWLSFVISSAADVVVAFGAQNAARDPFSVFATGAFFCALFVIFSGTGTFWCLWTLVHVALLAPGVVVNFGRFFYLETYVQMFRETFGEAAKETRAS